MARSMKFPERPSPKKIVLWSPVGLRSSKLAIVRAVPFATMYFGALEQRPMPTGVTPAPHVVSPLLPPPSTTTPPSFGGAPPAPEPPVPVEPPPPVVLPGPVVEPPVVVVAMLPVVLPVVVLPLPPPPVVLVEPDVVLGPVVVLPLPEVADPLPVWPEPPLPDGRVPPPSDMSEHAPATPIMRGKIHPRAREMRCEGIVDMAFTLVSRATSVQSKTREKALVCDQRSGSPRSNFGARIEFGSMRSNSEKYG
jgi:hypothetical protein